MALPSPNLDDRRFQQFVDDAKRYIQQRAPEWTDHNVSDPGVTLVETVAHMADQIVYRLNRVPEKNHLAFLDLVGVTLFPPSAARTDVTFWLSAPQEETVPVPVGTEVATLRTEQEEAVVFATEHELAIVPCAMSRLVVQHRGEPVADRTTALAEGTHIRCFAETPGPGDCMLIGLTAAVPHCAVALELDSRVDGVGVDPRQPPLVWEAWTEDGWQPCDIDRDGTGGLNRARRHRPARPRRPRPVPQRRPRSRLAALPGHRTPARPALLHHVPDRASRRGLHPRRHHPRRPRRHRVRRGARRIHRPARAATAARPRARHR
ncbi:hypothetical protein GCM10020000_69370 [Streptomyces olivoverticillatus]